VLGEGLQLALVGISIGLLFAVLLTRFLKFFLLGVSATDVLTFRAVGVLLCLVALLACFLPACRATRVDAWPPFATNSTPFSTYDSCQRRAIDRRSDVLS